MKKTISLILGSLVVVFFKSCSGPSSLEFNELRFNTPEQVADELGLNDLPEFYYVGNVAHPVFNFDYWDCAVEFRFRDSLSLQDRENIIRQVARKDELHWNYKDLPDNAVAEFYNIKYDNEDTLRLNVAITNSNIYVAYDDDIFLLTDELFTPEDYHLIGVRSAHFGPDSSHEWTIQLNKPYTKYLDKFKKSYGWKREDSEDKISFVKEIRNDQGYLQADECVAFIKKRNVVLINHRTF